MVTNVNFSSNADYSVALKHKGDVTQATGSGVGVDGATTAQTSYDTVSLKTSSMNASDLRLLRVQQLQDSIESGQYRVSAAALAGSMLEKATTGEAPELSFLTDSAQN